MKIMGKTQAQALDRQAQELGISGVLLMEHAAQALYERVMAAVQRQGSRIAVVCGSGNNGGDGYALARLLAQHDDLSLCIVKIGASKTTEAMQFEALAAKLELPVIMAEEADFHYFDVIVDCLLGIGLDRDISGRYAQVIHAINAANAYVIACDIPSGINADSGQIMGNAIRAQETVSFACGKLGLYVNEGIKHSGKITVADITIPACLSANHAGLEELNKNAFHTLVPKRQIHSHKGSYGKLLMIGGRNGMSGALLLAAQAALRCGVGTCTLMSEPHTLAAGAVMIPEAMQRNLPQLHAPTFADLLAQYDVIAIGNGLGRDEQAAWLVEQVWKSDRPALFDGDALFALGHWKSRSRRQSSFVLTPHPKELSYLLGIEVQKILKNPSEALNQSEKAFCGGTLVLKNTSTIITDGQQRYLYPGGNDGLASGGSGDVLSGMISGFLGQGAPLPAALCGVILHAHCADLLTPRLSGYALLPSDLITQIPDALQDLLQQK